MSRHVIRTKCGLEAHAGYCRTKGALYAQVYLPEQKKPIDAGNFGMLGTDALDRFLKAHGIDSPAGFLDSLLEDLFVYYHRRLVVWNENGQIESDSARTSLH